MAHPHSGIIQGIGNKEVATVPRQDFYILSLLLCLQCIIFKLRSALIRLHCSVSTMVLEAGLESGVVPTNYANHNDSAAVHQLVVF